MADSLVVHIWVMQAYSNCIMLWVMQAYRNCIMQSWPLQALLQQLAWWCMASRDKPLVLRMSDHLSAHGLYTPKLLVIFCNLTAKA